MRAASISQRGRNFVPGHRAHTDAAQPGVAVQASIAQEVSMTYTNMANKFRYYHY